MKYIEERDFDNLVSAAGMQKSKSVIMSDSSVMHLHWKQPLDYVAFARLLTELFRGCDQWLRFDEFGIWSASENLYEYRIVTRELFGSIPQKHDQPMLFEADDNEGLSLILQLGLQFGWGGLLLSRSGEWLCFDHDGFGSLKSNSNASLLTSIAGVEITPFS